MLSSTRNTTRPIMLCFDLNTITVAEIEAICYGNGLAYAVDADVKAAKLTTTQGNVDIHIVRSGDNIDVQLH